MAINGLPPTQFTRASVPSFRPATPVSRSRNLSSALSTTSPTRFAKDLQYSKPSKWTEIVKTKLVTKHSLSNLLAQRDARNSNVVSPTQVARRWSAATRIDVFA